MRNARVIPLVAVLWLALVPAVLAAEPSSALAATWDGHVLADIAVAGERLPGVSARLDLVDPRTKKPADPGRFAVQADAAARDGALWLTGVVTATVPGDAVVDLVLRVDGVALATGDGVSDPLLLAAKLLNKLPIAPLRTLADGQDRLALAMPAEAPYVFEFRALPQEKAVVMRLPFGLSDASVLPAALRRRAPFSILVLATEPRWHFRSALAAYYRLFPRAFDHAERHHGGWFFANDTKNIPNPQHFAFHEGEGNLQEDHDRGLGMFPYNETGSETIQLAGPGLPKDYADAIGQMEALERQRTPVGWRMNGGTLDEETRHDGRYAFRAESDRPGVSRYVNQFARLKTPVAEPVLVTAWGRAAGVSAGGNPNDYSIYVDCLLADGGYQFGQCAVFRPGTHDWEKAEWRIQPRAAIVELRVYAMFRNRTGTAWFDDVRLARQSQPDENLIENGDFEAIGTRRDIQFVRDNAMADDEGRLRVLITDNWGSDIAPETPLSLLRFVCNVDPDWHAPEGRPTPADRGRDFFDGLFKANPGIDGCYIDGAGAWTCWYLNHREDHFAAAAQPLTYAPGNFRLAQPGGVAMWKWLRHLQARYRPRGKTILGNMGPTTDAWTSYTALDIIGIESSHFQDTALMGYHRYGAYQKPVLPMNFINLHKLDDRATAEEFVLASAQWGHFPSTGRFVREGYQSYGDVCHAYYPALGEMAEAGWEPVPLVAGVAAERFGAAPPVYLTVRAPEDGRRATLVLLKAAWAGLRNPVVMDAVQLTPVPAQVTAAGLAIGLIDGARELTILRVSSRDDARGWLLARAAGHCRNAALVRGRAENSGRLEQLARELPGATPSGRRAVGAVLARIQAERTRVEQEAASLEKTSTLTELLDAERAVAEWVLLNGGAHLDVSGDRVVAVSARAAVTPVWAAGKTGATVLGCWPGEGRNVLRRHGPDVPVSLLPTGQPVGLQRERPGAMFLCTAVRVPVPGAAPVVVVRPTNVYFTPVVRARAERAVEAATLVYRVVVERLAAAGPLTVRAAGRGLTLTPADVRLGPEQSVAEFRLKAEGTTEVVGVTFTVHLPDGRSVAETSSEFRNLPVPPAGNLALASGGAEAVTDSSYSQYSPAAILDGVWETTGLHWTKRAWASADAAAKDGHWVEIRLPKPTPVSQAWIYWAIDDSRVFSSRDYDIELWDGRGWKPVCQVRENPLSTLSRHTWPSTVTERVRIHQLPGGGPSSRPNIMWVTEVCLYNSGTLN